MLNADTGSDSYYLYHSKQPVTVQSTSTRAEYALDLYSVDFLLVYSGPAIAADTESHVSSCTRGVNPSCRDNFEAL